MSGRLENKKTMELSLSARHAVTASLSFAASSSGKIPFDGRGYVSPKFKVFVQMQNRGNPSTSEVHRCFHQSYPLNFLHCFKLFRVEVMNLRVISPSGIVISTVRARDIYIKIRVLHISIILVWNKLFTGLGLLICFALLFSEVF